MSEGTLIKPDCSPQEAWDQSGHGQRTLSSFDAKDLQHEVPVPAA